MEPRAVDDALWTERTLVKLWAMRGTLHLLPSAELGVFLSALGTYTDRGMRGHPELDRLSDAVGRALDGRVLTREELALEVERATGEPALADYVRFSWGSYLKPASFRGRLCFAESDGGRVRFTSPETWLSGAIERPDPDAARRDVSRRYLAAYGPATPEDLALWWGGFGPARGARMLAALGDEAVEVELEDRSAFMLAGDAREAASCEPPQVARLLPAFDPWIVGASRRSPELLVGDRKARVYRPQGWISPVLLLDGRTVGVWRHERKGTRVVVELEPFGRLAAWAREQLEAEAERLAAFLGCRLELRRPQRAA